MLCNLILTSSGPDSDGPQDLWRLLGVVPWSDRYVFRAILQVRIKDLLGALLEGVLGLLKGSAAIG